MGGRRINFEDLMIWSEDIMRRRKIPPGAIFALTPFIRKIHV
jgi:hypothetical protein